VNTSISGVVARHSAIILGDSHNLGPRDGHEYVREQEQEHGHDMNINIQSNMDMDMYMTV
jgi:hypothetical protein